MKIGRDFPVKEGIIVLLFILLHLILIPLSPLLLNPRIHLHLNPIIPLKIKVPQLLNQMLFIQLDLLIQSSGRDLDSTKLLLHFLELFRPKDVFISEFHLFHLFGDEKLVVR